ncbi:hypothetical protein ACJJTC_014389 [Scirpophaga incertulas]
MHASVILFAFALIRISLSSSINKGNTYKDYRYYEVEGDIDNIRELVVVMDELAEMPYYNVRQTTAHFLIAPELVQIFEEAANHLKLKAVVQIEDYSEIIRLEKSDRRSGDSFSWTAYYDVDSIYGYLQNMSEAYPETTQLIVAGKSYEGRKLLGLRINTAKETRENPVVFLESGIHAREWITPATTTYFINELLTSQDPNVTSLRDSFDWRIFPTVNPDGYQYSFKFDRMWRKTRSKSSLLCRGVDANRNWGYNWLKHGASSNPCDYQTYAGPKAFSEKETRDLKDYLSGLQNLLAYIAFHSDAQMLLVPYSDSVEHNDNYDDLIRIGNTSLKYGEKVNGEKYEGPGTAAELLYKASGGSMDWVRYELGTPLVYTYELRGTYFHWPPSRINEQGNEVTQMMLGLFTEAKELGYY